MRKIILLIAWISPMLIGVMTFFDSAQNDAFGQIATGIIWAGDTVGNEVPDKLSAFNETPITDLLEKWNRTWSFSVRADSVLEVSDTPDFTPGRTMKIPAGLWFNSELLDVTVFREMYIRKFGTYEGTTEYVISARGF